MKDIIKACKSLEDRGLLLEEITEKITCQEEGFLKFFLGHQ